MRSLLALACVVSLTAMSPAQAQQREIPEALRAAGEAAIAYGEALPTYVPDVFSNVSLNLNRPVEEVRSKIVKDRTALKGAIDDLANLKLPASKMKGFDVSFVLQRMRQDSESRFAVARRALDAFEAMVNASISGDCAEYKVQAEVLDTTRRELARYSKWRDLAALQTFIGNFDDSKLVARQPPPAPAPLSHSQRLDLLASELAVALRCPAPDTPFDMEVTIPFLASARANDKVQTIVKVTSGLDVSQRAAIEHRFSDFVLPLPSRFAKWAEIKPSMKFRWDGHVLWPGGE